MSTVRSNRSSLVGLPTTVAEDESLVEDFGVQDENRPNWNEFRRDPNDFVMREEEEEISVSSPVDEIIKTFNNELEAMRISFDTLISRQNSAPYSMGTETSYSRRSVEPFPNRSSLSRERESSFAFSSMETSRKDPLSEEDPPVSSQRPSPSRNPPQSTPVRRSDSFSYTPSEPPPAPVQTPAFQMPTPNRGRRSTRNESFSTDRYNQEPASRTGRMEPQEIHFNLGDSPEDPIMKLHELIKGQERRIRDLEVENEKLRKKELLRPPEVQRVNRGSPSVISQLSSIREGFHATTAQYDVRRDPAYRHRSRSEQYVREDPGGRRQDRPGISSSPYRTSQSAFSSQASRNRRVGPPRQIQTLTDAVEDLEGNFTRGTRFVSQLATLMSLEKEHFVPLSMIMDKHWDNLKHHFVD